MAVRQLIPAIWVLLIETIIICALHGQNIFLLYFFEYIMHLIPGQNINHFFQTYKKDPA